MNVVCDGAGRFIEVQGTGERAPFDRARLDELLDLAGEGARRLVEVQRMVLADDIEVFSERG
jgi:ribonuclease PH